jgi:uncharacterized membrane protein YraQ (UPF0718 family)
VKNSISLIKRFRMLILPVFLYIALLFISPETVYSALDILMGFLAEMLQILPMIFILSALIGEWIPREIITRHLGQDAGWKGMVYSLILGSISAGPIYAAFPLALTLKKKGASIGNVVVIISSWAVVKIPMLMMELKFLGLRFTVLRYLITVPSIFLLGWLMNLLFREKEDELNTKAEPSGQNLVHAKELLDLLPGHDCGVCGFGSCKEMAINQGSKKLILEKCVFVG